MKDDVVRVQQERVLSILKASPIFEIIFARASQINLPNWYVAGGVVTQSIWNSMSGLDPLHGLKDIDLVYFQKDQSEIDEAIAREEIKGLFVDLPLPFDVINQARVHLWYQKKFGSTILPYASTEDGLSDTFGMRLRPNKRQITEEIYNKMASRLLLDWPTIQVMPWL